MRRLRQFDVRPNRELGQNFLIDDNLLGVIDRAAELDPGDVVLEVGGGLGVLSEHLAPRVAHLHVVEVDRSLEPPLQEALAPFGNATLHLADAVRLDFGALVPTPTKVVANLPYGVAATVLLKSIAELPEREPLGGDGPARGRRAARGRPRQPRVRGHLRARPARLRGARAPQGPAHRVPSRAARGLRASVHAPPRPARPTMPCATSSTRASPTGARRSPARWRSRPESPPGLRDSVRAELELMELPADARAERLRPEHWTRLAARARPALSRAT